MPSPREPRHPRSCRHPSRLWRSTNAALYDDIRRLHLNNLKSLSSALSAKDYYTLGHAARVAAYSVLLGRELGWSDEVVAQAEEAAYLHDIGKIAISDRVLLKPSRLNEREWELMRQHPSFSADIISALFASGPVDGVRHHHERYDGTGYPDGLAGDEIPALAMAMGVVDAYDAMSSWRPYRPAMDYAECLAELDRCRGSAVRPRRRSTRSSACSSGCASCAPTADGGRRRRPPSASTESHAGLPDARGRRPPRPIARSPPRCATSATPIRRHAS